LGDYRNYLDHKFSGHSAFHMMSFRIHYRGHGEIKLGECGFHKNDIVYEYIFNCQQNIISSNRFDRTNFGLIVLPNSKDGYVDFVVPFTDLHMMMKKFKLTFRGVLNISSMVVETRIWNTSVCIALLSCSRKCDFKKQICNRKIQCIKAPMTSCDYCRASYLHCLYVRTSMFTNDSLIEYLGEEKKLRECYESLVDDMFFNRHEEVLYRLQPLNQRMYDWMKCYKEYGSSCISVGFPKKQFVVSLHRFESDGNVVEINRYEYDKESNNVVSEDLLWKERERKIEIGSIDDFLLSFIFTSIRSDLCDKLCLLLPEMKSLYSSYTIEDRQILYDIEDGKIAKEAKAIVPLMYEDMMEQYF